MKILGLMTGTSLDGLDLCLAEFNRNKWQILNSQTVPYSPTLSNYLKGLYFASGNELAKAHFTFSEKIARIINRFLKNSPMPDYIAFPGQTIFHRASEGYTFQLGSGAVLSVLTGIPVVADFRSSDVALGGQGAPLVPCGEFELWKNYDAFLNLGGIANISFKKKNIIHGMDICPCNIPMNELAQREGKNFDPLGSMARSASYDRVLVKELINSYAKSYKSLGYENYEKNWKKLLNKRGKKYNRVLMSSVNEAIAVLISKKIRSIQAKNIMVTGGGAFNGELIRRLCEKCGSDINIHIPSEEIIKFKEALVFALLAWKRVRNEKNVLSSVTGSRKDHCAGCIYLP